MILCQNIQSTTGEIIRNYAIAFRWPSAIAACPAGKFATGGGANCKGMSGKGWVVLIENSPISDREWKATCDTSEFQNVMIEVWVFCE